MTPAPRSAIAPCAACPAPRLALVAAVLLQAACAPFPEVPMPEGPAGDYPALLPLDALLAQADHPAA